MAQSTLSFMTIWFLQMLLGFSAWHLGPVCDSYQHLYSKNEQVIQWKSCGEAQESNKWILLNFVKPYPSILK